METKKAPASRGIVIGLALGAVMGALSGFSELGFVLAPAILGFVLCSWGYAAGAVSFAAFGIAAYFVAGISAFPYVLGAALPASAVIGYVIYNKKPWRTAVALGALLMGIGLYAYICLPSILEGQEPFYAIESFISAFSQDFTALAQSTGMDEDKLSYVRTGLLLYEEMAERMTMRFICTAAMFFALIDTLIARAFTRRKKIVFFKGYYHGVSPWTQKIDYSGVLKEDVCNNLYADWNDFEGLEALFEAHKGEIAAVISQPYMHGNFADNELPADGFWQKVRRLCTEQGALLIVDDVRAGFRLSLAGSDSYFGFEADLICFCKAIANGYNVSALCGKDFLKNTVSGISFTGSYWLSAVPFAAGIACLEKMKKLNLPELLIEKGKRLTDGLTAAARKHGHDLRASGVPSLFYLRIADDDNLMTHQRFIAEMVRRGVYMTNHHNHFINYALSDADIDETVEIADEVLRLL